VSKGINGKKVPVTAHFFNKLRNYIYLYSLLLSRDLMENREEGRGRYRHDCDFGSYWQFSIILAEAVGFSMPNKANKAFFTYDLNSVDFFKKRNIILPFCVDAGLNLHFHGTDGFLYGPRSANGFIECVFHLNLS
jgi:hypothetical protein